MITNADILAAIEPAWTRGKPERVRFLQQNRAAALARLTAAVEILREQEAFTAEASPLVDLRDKLERRLIEAAAAGAHLDGGMLREELWSLREPLGDFVAAPRRIDDARKVLKMAGMLAAAGPCRPRVEAMMRPSEPPLERAPVRVNRKALRAALSRHPELVEALEAVVDRGAAVEEASYSADVGVMWKLAMDSLYKSSDLPALGTREALQNSVDAIRAAIKAKQVDKGAGYFRVIWDPARRALSWEDNGLGMDAETVISKFLSLGSSGKRDAVDSDEAAGGFGIAKAVILGTSSTFRWEMHTRDNIFISDGFSSKVKRYKADYRQGTYLTVYDVAQEYDRQYDYAERTYMGIVERLRRLLGASDLPDITLSVNGSEVPMMFPRRSGTKVPVAGNWGTDVEVSIKAYRRAEGDRQGAYYVRLGGLFQFPISGHNLKRDFVLDFTTKARPGSRQYPFNAARDSFAGQTSDAFDDFREEVETDTESTGRDLEDEIYDPESDDADSRSGANELGELAAEAFADPELQRAMAQAAGGIVDYYAERQRGKIVRGDDEQTSFAPAGSRARPKDDDEERDSEPAAIPPGFKSPGSQLYATVIDDPRNAAVELRMVLSEAANANEAGVPSSNIITPTVDTVLRAAESGQELTTRDVEILTDAIDRATENSMAPGGGGLIQAAAVDQAADKALRGMLRDVPALKPAKRNPFGKLAGLRINKKNYDRQKAYRFKKNFKRWIPYLTLWDAVLRLVANEAGIRRRFKPGFVLNDTLNGLASDSVIYINPDKMAAAVRAHRLRPIAAAGYIHAKAVHELTHFKCCPEHNEDFVSHREDLSAATFHLLPAIALLTQKIMQLPETPDQKSVAKLEKQLERAKRGKGKRSDEEYTALRKQLAELRSELAESARESERLQTELEEGADRPRVTPAELLDAWVGAKAIYDNARARILGGASEPEIARLHSALRRAAAHVGQMALACEERQEQLAVPDQPPSPSRCRDDVRELDDGKGPILVRTRCNYDPVAAAAFKRNIAAWRPHFDAWQKTLEITARAGGLDRKFRCGLLLCTENVAFATETDDGGDPVIYLQPELLQDAIELDPDPHAVAGYLKPAAEHELAHLPLMGKGHNTEFIASRENLAQRTGKVIPKIVEVAETLLRRTEGMPRYRRREEALKRTAGRLPVQRAVAMVRSAAGPGCLRPDWRKRRPKNACPVWGCCYVAAEAVYHLAGGAESGLRPMFVRHEESPHWYLVDAHGRVVDPTAEQFASPPDYSKGIGKGFLTLEPSARATALMRAALAGERVEGCPMPKAAREEACPCSHRAGAMPRRVEALTRGEATAITVLPELALLAAEAMPKSRSREGPAAPWSRERMLEWARNAGRASAKVNGPIDEDEEDEDRDVALFGLRALDGVAFANQITADIDKTGGELQDALIEAFREGYDEIHPLPTEEPIDEARAAQAHREFEERRKRLRHPHTLDDFAFSLANGGRDHWTPAMSARYDQLRADPEEMERYRRAKGPGWEAQAALQAGRERSESLRTRQPACAPNHRESDKPHLEYVVGRNKNGWYLSMYLESCQADAAFMEVGRSGNGHDWEDLLRAELEAEDRVAAAALEWDPESDLFEAKSAREASIRKLEHVLTRLLADRRSLRHALHRLRGRTS